MLLRTKGTDLASQIFPRFYVAAHTSANTGLSFPCVWHLLGPSRMHLNELNYGQGKNVDFSFELDAESYRFKPVQ